MKGLLHLEPLLRCQPRLRVAVHLDQLLTTRADTYPNSLNDLYHCNRALGHKENIV
jgi:hypothetical protein